MQVSVFILPFLVALFYAPVLEAKGFKRIKINEVSAPAVKSGGKCEAASNAFMWFFQNLDNSSLASTPIYSPSSLTAFPFIDGFFTELTTGKQRRRSFVGEGGVVFDTEEVVSFITETVNGLLTAQAVGKHTTLGEMSYACSLFAQQVSSFLSGPSSSLPTTSELWGWWTKIWLELAERVGASGEREGYGRAMNYAFIAQQPYPLSDIALLAFNTSYFYMEKYLDATYPGLWKQVSIPFNNTDTNKRSSTLNGYTNKQSSTLNGNTNKQSSTQNGNTNKQSSTLNGYTNKQSSTQNGYTNKQSSTQNGYANKQSSTLNGYLLKSPNPKPSTSNKLIIASAGGLDWPTPGMLAQQEPEILLEEGYSIVIYEGPGQGIGSRYSNSRFTHEWHVVLDAVAEWCGPLSSDLVSLSWSFGGFLTAEGCALATNPGIKACIIDPATPNFAFSINYLSLGWAVVPYTGQQKQVGELCGATCASFLAYYANCTSSSNQATWEEDGLMTGLLGEDCGTGRGLLEKVYTEGFQQSPFVETDQIYLVLKLVPMGPSTYSSLGNLSRIVDTDPEALSVLFVEGLEEIQKYRTTQTEVAHTMPAILAIGGSEDFALQSTSTASYFHHLPSNPLSSFFFFTPESGAASHDEAGASLVSMPLVLKFLEST
eukprot:CAMPEP_0174253880 /NCGR_PEP_ID=MMETSP0439-20130205/3250_1 /TAXON_ID=0 /ORGANISM="Stereomyxa ramosa, Strain Chinc5" /LENGTH=654 /DNA_ID=CAMNT_0015335177 /DNA_START=53 /DNA_END=2017 /DNA_ORIENTATION=-